jgi:hypothetical protein
MPASATDDQVGQAVAGLERGDDRQDRGGLGLVALEAADLQREAAPVDQEPDHDLRVDAAFLGVADLAQVVLLLGLEVQGGHVVEAQRDVAAGPGVGEARRGDLVAVVTVRPGAGQGPFHRRVAGRRPAQVTQDPPDIEQRGGFHHPGDHQIGEHPIGEGVEPQIGVDPGQGVVEQPGIRGQHPTRTVANRPWRRARHVDQLRRLGGPDQWGDRRRGMNVEPQHALRWICEQLTGPLEQHPQLGLGMRRPDMGNDPLPAVGVLRDLHRGGTRPGPNPPDERHPATLRDTP